MQKRIKKNMCMGFLVVAVVLILSTSASALTWENVSQVYYSFTPIKLSSALDQHNSSEWWFTYNQTELTDGTYTYYGWANDTSGNSNTSGVRTLTIDDVPETPTLSTPTDGYHTNDNTTTFDWDDNNDHYLDKYNLRIWNNSALTELNLNKTSLSTSTYTLTAGEALPDGTYYWEVRCNTTNGVNSSWSGNWSFTVDTINPMITLTYPDEDNSSVVDLNFTLNASASDSNLNQFGVNITNSSGTEMYSFWVQNISTTTYNHTATVNTSTWNAGTYTLTLNASDDGSSPPLRNLKAKAKGEYMKHDSINKEWSKDLSKEDKLEFIDYSSKIDLDVFSIKTNVKSKLSLKLIDENRHYKIGWIVDTKDVGKEFIVTVTSESEAYLTGRNKLMFGMGVYSLDFKDLVGFEYTIKKVNNKTHQLIVDLSGLEGLITMDPVVSGTNTAGKAATFEVVHGLTDCGEVSSSISLLNNLSANGSCIIITGHNINLDCAGYTITGNKTSGIGVNCTDYDNLTLTNCTVDDFTYDIYLWNVSGALINATKIFDFHAYNSTPVAINIPETNCRYGFRDARIKDASWSTCDFNITLASSRVVHVESYEALGIPPTIIIMFGAGGIGFVIYMWRRRRRR